MPAAGEHRQLEAIPLAAELLARDRPQHVDQLDLYGELALAVKRESSEAIKRTRSRA
jgi:hypothetical protein